MANEEKLTLEGAEAWRPEEDEKAGPSLAEIFEQAKAKIGDDEAYQKAKETEVRFREFAGKLPDIRTGRKLYENLSKGELVDERTAVWEIFGLTSTPIGGEEDKASLLKTYGGLTETAISGRLRVYESPSEFLGAMEKFLVALETGAEQSVGGTAVRASYARNAERGRHVLLGFGLRALKEEDYNSAVDAFVMTGFDKKNSIQKRLARAAEEHPLEIAIALEPYVTGKETKKSEVAAVSETEA